MNGSKLTRKTEIPEFLVRYASSPKSPLQNEGKIIEDSIMKQTNTEKTPAEQMREIRLNLIEYAATHTLEEIMTRALDDISEFVASAIAFYHFVAADQKTLSLRQWSTRTLKEFRRAEGKGLHYPIEKAGVWADCARQKKPIVHNDYVSLEGKQGMPDGHAEVIRELVVPVMRNNKVVAILGVGNKPGDYTKKDVETVSYLSDVTWEIIQRKRAEEALIDSEKRYRRLFESAKDGILILDAYTGMVVDVNPFLTRLLGYSYEDLCGKLIWEIGTFKDVSSSKEAFKKLQDSEYIRYEDLPLETADGRKIEVEFVSNVYLVDHTKVIQCNIRDITERRRGDAERKRLLSAIEQAGEMIVITDPGGAIQFVNPAFEQMTGYTSQEAIGQNPRMLKSGEQDQAFYRNLWETISIGNTFTGRMVNKRKDGTFFTEDATISPVRDATGLIVNYVAVKRDVTERLRLAALLRQAQKMESVGRLAGGVAHDFNNMLGVILGHAGMALEEGNLSVPLYAHLEEILHAAERSAEITRQLLAFARKQIIAPKVLDLNDTVAGMLKMLRRLIGEDILLAWMPGAKLWPVRVDASQIDQILANLCINARDAIADVGRISIETENVVFDKEYCALRADVLPGEYVLLSVSDDGCGMGKDVFEYLFEPFFTTKEVGKGTGLGLATVYGIVKQNEGFINVYSEPGQGAAFKIYLPRHVGEAKDEKSDFVTEIPPGCGEMVLLVEDEPQILDMVQMLLERLGYQVLTADRPSKAVRLAAEHAGGIHLLITDVVMPEMNGRDLANRLQTLHPEMKNLFMSGYTADVIAHRGVLEEGVHFLQKPFSMRDLGLKIRSILNQG